MVKVKVRKNDEFRVLVTDVLPAETPIVFSNDGFYLRCSTHGKAGRAGDLIFKKLVSQDAAFEKRRYVPYTYRIKKSALNYRRESL